MNPSDRIVPIVREHYPATQAIYLFGTYGTPDEWPHSDVDIAVLLPHEQSRSQSRLMFTPCHDALGAALGKRVDLVNAREVSTVFQVEIIASGRPLFCDGSGARAEFEMLALSLYQKLNEERSGIIESFLESGRAYAV
ncbi:MAG: nucleotidyltransferase domain-containing protein [Bryobacteraceae bacterium]|nr:nucleotidyltransferase domain-containing protein [Bryobacteraceae bacterium]